MKSEATTEGTGLGAWFFLLGLSRDLRGRIEWTRHPDPRRCVYEASIAGYERLVADVRAEMDLADGGAVLLVLREDVSDGGDSDTVHVTWGVRCAAASASAVPGAAGPFVWSAARRT